MVINLLTVEDAVDHMAAKQPHFDFITSMRINLFVFMDALKDIGGS